MWNILCCRIARHRTLAYRACMRSFYRFKTHPVPSPVALRRHYSVFNPPDTGPRRAASVYRMDADLRPIVIRCCRLLGLSRLINHNYYRYTAKMSL